MASGAGAVRRKVRATWRMMLGLCCKDVDLLRGHVRVEQQIIEVRSKFLSFGPIKTDADRRTVTMPKFLVEMMEEQLAERTEPGGDGLVFVNTAGNSPHASSFNGQTYGSPRSEPASITSAGTTSGTPPSPSPSSKARTPRPSRAHGTLEHRRHPRPLRAPAPVHRGAHRGRAG